MWNLKMPDISAARAQMDEVFPNSALHSLVLSEHKNALEVIYREYQETLGRPNPLWVNELTKEAREAILEAFGEVQEGGKLGVLRAMLKLNVNECPYCGFGEIKDLDHHLQKAHFKCLSIFPLNLVPACSKCNGHKARKPRFDPAKYHIHAYLDDLSAYRFLVAKVRMASGSIQVKFTIEKTKEMSDELYHRLEQHLVEFHLNDRYQAQINIYLNEQKVALELASEWGGEQGIVEFLNRSAVSAEKAFGLNDWRVALLRALANCAYFCDDFSVSLGAKS